MSRQMFKTVGGTRQIAVLGLIKASSARISGALVLAITLAISLVLTPATARAAADCTLKKGGQARVVKIVDGDTVVLADGRQVRLVGTQAPKLPLGRKGYKAWPLGQQSKAALGKLVAGKRVELRYGGLRQDRYGRQLAHLFVIDAEPPLWVQGEMVSAGMARTYSFRDNRACVRTLQAREAAARRAGLGIWSLDFYAIRDAKDTAALNALMNTFQIIEGVVQSAVVVKNRGFLNFGKNYRDDFTAVVRRRDLRLFDKAAMSFEGLQGKRVRVRGWLGSRNGPDVEVTHPEQIELVQ